MTKQETINTSLILADKAAVALAFESDASLDAILRRIEAEAKAEVLTADTTEGRDRIKSLAYKIARSKTTMDDIGKGLTEEARKLQSAINARRNVVSARLDSLKTEVRAPLTAWEAAEDRRKDAHVDRMATEFSPRALPSGSAALQAMRDRAAGIEIDASWEEFTESAAKAKADCLRFLDLKIGDALREEEREAELQRLRAAEAQRKAQEAAEAQERAAREAEAQKEREAAQAAALEAQRAKDAEIAALKAELAATQKPVEVAPVKEAAAVEAAKIPVSAFVEQPAFAGMEFEEVLVAIVAEREISGAILSILRSNFTPESMADAIASAIMLGEIPNVQVVM